MLDRETEVIENIILVKGINLMMTKPSFPYDFSLLFTLDLCHPSKTQWNANSDL